MSDLSKWPRLLVVGKPVTRKQANEILIRTDPWLLMTNDVGWCKQVCQVADIPFGPYAHPDYKAAAAFARSVGGLDLHYLHNERIVCSWVGGPKGWCDWEGNIACSTWNIGKWPSVQEVTSDWTKIAAAFPYLDLRAQVVDDEGEADEPAAEWRVVDGRVHLVEPVGLLREPNDLDGLTIQAIFTSVTRERGVSLDRLREAIQQCRASQEGL